MCEPLLLTLPLLIGWMLDLLLGDPPYLPHPIVGFGKMISFGEHRLNKGNHRKIKGGIMAVACILLVFGVVWFMRHLLYQHIQPLGIAIDILIVFFCLAGTTLIREVRQVFVALDHSLEEGRKQVARIVGRDTSDLSAQ